VSVRLSTPPCQQNGTLLAVLSGSTSVSWRVCCSEADATATVYAYEASSDGCQVCACGPFVAVFPSVPCSFAVF
jgi:hypothetical protein